MSLRTRAKRAGRVSEYSIAVPQLRQRRRPSHGEAALQQLAGSRLMIPHGDRREFPQSSRVVDEHEPVGERDNDVVGELVLHNDVGENSR